MCDVDTRRARRALFKKLFFFRPTKAESSPPRDAVSEEVDERKACTAPHERAVFL